MNTSRRLNRRSFVTRVAGGLIVTGGAVALVAGPARAQNYTGVTDCDTGQPHDRPGYGVGNRTQYTDRDTGPTGDPRCRGRGPNRQEGNTSGNGNYNYGQPVTGCSDTDGGPGSDPGGRGLRCSGRTPPTHYPPGNTRHCTDSDRGNSADPVGQGVRC